MSPAAAQRLRYLASALTLLVALAAAAGGWCYFQLRASLPQLDGPHPLAGLSAPVAVTRDAAGVPTVRGASRADVARALGFLHAQERFFQMDLLRRRAAGELSEVIGKAALGLDRSARLHGFRARAQQTIAGLMPAERALAETYTAGVNAGLAALGARPFEYLALRTAPAPWRMEDSVLVVFAMTLDLQDERDSYEKNLATLRDTLGRDALAFFAPLLKPDDAALDGSTAPLPPVPGPKILDLRARPAAPTTALAPGEFPFVGSNAFALAGAHTAGGGALLASDPHLTLAVPNIWYRAVLEWRDGGQAQSIVGVTIPGIPFVIIGSNRHIAWGLTDAYADVSDLVAVDLNPISPDHYKIPGRDELLAIETRRETIRVKGAPDAASESRWTVWGPIIAADEKGRPLVHHWVAYEPGAINFTFGELENARTVREATAIAHRTGMPAHNFVVADTAGDIAWTITGRLPRRIGYDGRLPVSWSYGDRSWDGFLPPEKFPVVATPGAAIPGALPAPDGRLWSANHRHLGGTALATLGDAGYDDGARAAQIRDALAKVENATPRDLLAIQLDDRALFLAPWQKLLLATLTPRATATKPARAELRALAAKWEGRASVESVSYTLVREFRAAVRARVFGPIFAGCAEADESFGWSRFHLEPALWALLREKPAHLLDPQFATWDDLLVAAADDVVNTFERRHLPLVGAAWGGRNTAKILHPFGAVLPAWLAGWLNLPADPLPGDAHMPRVQGRAHGASMRLVVAPGREAEGIFEMPGGQSGHPLSPYFRTGHTAWVKGEPAPLLPGTTAHTLTLQP